MSKAITQIVQPDLFTPPSLKGATSFRDDLDIMSYPLLTVEKMRREPMLFGEEGKLDAPFIRVTGADFGIANRWDGEHLIGFRTQIVNAVQRGYPPGRRILLTPHDHLSSMNKDTSKRGYDRLAESLQRLKATTITTNLTSSDGYQLREGVSWIDSYRFVTKETARGQMRGGLEVVLSEWTYAMMMDPKRSLSFGLEYFAITGGIEKALFGIFRRHLGTQAGAWPIGIDKLQRRVGSTSEPRKFLEALRRIEREGSLPNYSMEITKHMPSDAMIGSRSLPSNPAFASRMVQPSEPITQPGRTLLVVVRRK